MSQKRSWNLLIVAILSVSMVLAAVAGSQSYAASTSQKAQQKKQEAAAAGQKADDLYKQVGEAEDKINELQSSINNKQAEINATQAKLSQKEAEVADQTESLNSRLRTMYKTGTVGFVDVILSSDNVTELITNVGMVQRVLSSDKQLLKDLEEDYDEIQELKQTQVQQEAALKEDKAEVEATRESMQSQAKAFEEKESQLSSEADSLAAQAAAEQAAAEAELARRQAAEQAAAAQKAAQQQAAQQQQQNNSSSSSSSSASKPAASTPAASTSTAGYRWPVNGGTITSWFGWRIHPIFKTRKYHDGYDVSGLPTGTPIYAVANGIVTRASYNGGYGNCVMISIGGGYTTLFAHLSRYAVSYGQYVTKGQVVGYVGSTGWSTGPHLHYSLLRNGTYVDPMVLKYS